VRQSVTDCTGGRTDVYNRDPALEPVVTCLVEEVAQGYDSHRFSYEVNREPRSRVSKNPDDGIQFLSAALQIRASDGEVRSV